LTSLNGGPQEGNLLCDKLSEVDSFWTAIEVLISGTGNFRK